MVTAEAAASSTVSLLAGSPSQRLTAARTIKNAVVGNPTNKRLYLRLCAIPPLVAAAAEVDSDPALAEQAVAALGSLAALFPREAVSTLTPVLLKALFSPDSRPVNAAARALKMLVTAEGVDIMALGPVIATPEVAPRLVALLSGLDEGIMEVCAVILSKSSVAIEQAKVYERAGAVPALVLLLCRTNHERCIEACLNAMAALARQDRGIAQAFASPHSIVVLVLPFTRSPRHSLRLSACRLLTILHSAAQLPSGLDGVITTALVGLLDSDHVHAKISTALTLAELVSGLEDLQRIATEADAIEQLTCIIKSTLDPADCMETNMHVRGTDGLSANDALASSQPAVDEPALKAASLTALAALCSDFDEAREKVVSLQILPHIVEALSGSSPDVVLASVKCIRSLSRSVKVLRRDLANERIGRVLLGLLSSQNGDIQQIVSATLCNLVLEFSPIRAVILDRGGTDVLVELLKSGDEESRKNALWALKNLLFKADAETKSTVMSKMGYNKLQNLCGDQNPRVRELAMRVVRNLACSGSAESQTHQLDALFAATGTRLISTLSHALRAGRDNSEIAVQALYVVCNIASGTEEHKICLMESDIPQLILRWTSHENERARIAAVWCAINLSWKERSIPARRSTRLMRRTQRSAVRSSQSRLDRLRRQHLPLPSSPLSRRELENADALDHQSADSSIADTANQSPSTDEMNDGEPNSNADQSSDERDEMLRDTVMTIAEGEQQTPKSSGYEWRIERLRELGFEGRLRSLVNDPHVEVQGRARAALQLFDCRESNALEDDQPALFDYNPSLMARQSESPRSPSILLRVTGSDSSSAGSSA